MTRLKGNAGGSSWWRIVVLILIVVAAALGLDYVDVLPLHFW